MDQPGLEPAFPLADRPMVMTADGEIPWSSITGAAHALAAVLPDGHAAINLCERRENFLIGVLALLVRRVTCVLPPSRAPAIVGEILERFPGGFLLDDALVGAARISAGLCPAEVVAPEGDSPLLIAFTSGSTGKPTAVPKTWGSFLASARLNARALNGALQASGDEGRPWILATVPSQHMYGVETTVLLPLLAGMGIHSANPLYPADIMQALRRLPEPRILVTTPAHLRAVLHANIQPPRLAAVVCATAPLPREMARTAEQFFGAPVVEFFGATETCVIASRRPAYDLDWQLYEGVEVIPGQMDTEVNAAWFPQAVQLPDIIEMCDQARFVVKGRQSDVVKIAGKRASLAALSGHLAAIPGVVDSVILQPDASEGGKVERLAALVVAKDINEAEILRALSKLVDAAFLPRPLVLVERLPRNDVGKLPRERILELLRQATRKGGDGFSQP